jgi:sarcosine oxidase
MGYGADEIYTRWSMRSLGAWRQLFERVRQPELFQNTGMLWTASETHPHIQGTRQVFERLGVRYEALGQDELARRYPQFRFASGTAGIFEPESGALLASRAVAAAAQEAVRLGAHSVTAQVSPPTGRGRLEAISTGAGGIAAANFVFACGPWLPKLFPALLGGRIHVTRQSVFYFAAPPGERFDAPAMPIWIDFSDPRGGYTLPRMAGKEFKLALDRHGPGFDPDTGSRDVTTPETAEARAFLEERFPELAGAPLAASEVCQYENTSNGDFLIDRHPEWENVWLAGGGSGHGFKHGPAVGEYISEILCGRIAAEPRFSVATKTTLRSRTVY